MTYLQNEKDSDPEKLPPEVLKARVEQMVPGFALAVKNAAKANAALALPYSRMTNTATPLLYVDCEISGMMLHYAWLHEVHLLIMPVTNQELEATVQRSLAKQKA